MKQAIKRLLNSVGLYTYGQVRHEIDRLGALAGRLDRPGVRPLLHTLGGILAGWPDEHLAEFAPDGSPPDRAAIEPWLTEARRAVGFERARAASRIRELYLRELFGPDIDEVSLPVGAVNEETLHPNPTDMLFVCAIAKHRKARRIMELGTYQGRTTYHLTYASDDAVVTTVNIPPEKTPSYAPFLQNYFKGRPRAGRIRQVWSDLYELDTTPYRHAMDFIFIDADHTYEAVKNDTAKAFEMLAPGGAVVWHDYAPKSPGVYRFLQEFTQDRPLFRIHKTCLAVYLDGVDVYGFRPYPMLPSKAGRSVKRAA